jgi:hypothetical protein
MRPVDAAIYATLVAFVLGDLLPGPTVAVAAGVAIACGVAVLCHDVVARTLFGVFLGMLVGMLGVVILAFAHR